ncbi:hypothetical protein Droror1_Dr00008867 [Drosera rotundifolia]
MFPHQSLIHELDSPLLHLVQKRTLTLVRTCDGEPKMNKSRILRTEGVLLTDARSTLPLSVISFSSNLNPPKIPSSPTIQIKPLPRLCRSLLSTLLPLAYAAAAERLLLSQPHFKTLNPKSPLSPSRSCRTLSSSASSNVLRRNSDSTMRWV